MNVLKPNLVWIRDRCYRKLPIRENLKNPEDDYLYSGDVEVKGQAEDEEDYYEDVDIKSEGNTFWTSFSVPNELMGHVVGKENAVRKRIEEQTKTKISIPRKNRMQNQGDITIEGPRNGVGEAYRLINDIINKVRWKTPFTHFISFPMNHEDLQSSFIKFKDDVLRNFNLVRGIHKSIFQNPCKLHLTVATLVLLDDKERNKAASVLQTCRSDILDIIGNKPLTVLVKGVEYMNDDPAEVDVLYAKVCDLDEDDNSLQIISNKLSTAFVDAKLSKQQYDSVKLHMTLMNSLFREEAEHQAMQDRSTFDATPLLKKYSDYEFGKAVITEIHISIRHQQRRDGYYYPSSFIKLPS